MCRSTAWQALGFAASLAVASGCSPSMAPSDGSDALLDAGSPDNNIDCTAEFNDRLPDAATPTLAQLTLFFGHYCTATNCHGDSPAQGFSLVGDGLYDSLRAPAVEYPSLHRIEPGDPNRSYLWLKLEGCYSRLAGCQRNPDCGSSMPMTSPESAGFTLSQAAVLYDWIVAGAPQN